MISLNQFPILIATFLLIGIPFSPAQEPGLTESLVKEIASQSPFIWRYSCDKENPESCYIRYELHVSQTLDGGERPIGKLLSATVLYIANEEQTEPSLFLSLSLPLGVDLRPGAIIKVDGGERENLPFLQCTQKGCDVSRVIDADFLAALKQGKILYVAFIAWGGSKTSILEVS